MLRKVLRYFCVAVCQISIQEILLVTASILSYVLFGAVMRSLYLWILILACDLTVIGAHGAYLLRRPHCHKGPWHIPTPLILRWVCFIVIGVSQNNEIATTFAWYLMVFASVCHAFYCILLTMNAHSSTWLEGTNGEIGAPNWISITRMGLSVLVPHLYAVQPFGPSSSTIATIILLLAIITDAADGFIARKLDQCTKAGKALDPLGDKIIFYPTAIAFILATHGTVLLSSVALRVTFYVCFAIMLTRDVLYIIWFALYYRKLSDGMGASMVDKVRMATLCAWLGIAALALTIPNIQARMAAAGFVFMVIIAVLSVISFFVDFARMRAAFKAQEQTKDEHLA